MRKSFYCHADALRFGREFANTHNVRVYAVVVYPTNRDYKSLTWVFTSAGNGGAFKSAWITSDCSPGGGWYFGGATKHPTDAEVETLVVLPELPALTGKREEWYGLVAAYTAGWSHEQRLLLAERCDQTGGGVWHESHRLHKELNPESPVVCPCGPCRKQRGENR